MKIAHFCLCGLSLLITSRVSSGQHQQQPPPQHHQQQPPPQQQQGHPQQQQGHPQQQQGHPQQGQQQRQFAAQNEVQDQEHIKTHLEGQVNVDTKQMTNEQLQFHYFSMHDLNKDSKLDGLELIKAITHWHGPEGSEPQGHHAPPQLAENEIEDMIDSILKDDDFNDDGYIDYSEFVKAQTTRMAQQQHPPQHLPPQQQQQQPPQGNQVHG